MPDAVIDASEDYVPAVRDLRTLRTEYYLLYEGAGAARIYSAYTCVTSMGVEVEQLFVCAGFTNDS